MDRRIICLCVLMLLPGCKRAAKVESTTRVESRTAIDFEQLLLKIKNCNEQELGYFDRNWAEIHMQLEYAADNQLLVELPLNQQEELWDALSYLQSCRHGRIMHEHGDDMVKILFQFGTKDQLSLLREIHPDGK